MADLSEYPDGEFFKEIILTALLVKLGSNFTEDERKTNLVKVAESFARFFSRLNSEDLSDVDINSADLEDESLNSLVGELNDAIFYTPKSFAGAVNRVFDAVNLLAEYRPETLKLTKPTKVEYLGTTLKVTHGATYIVKIGPNTDLSPETALTGVGERKLG